ncbi:MAG: hypothetical protein FGM14_12400 [Flavobacteriales bacterium]|nr:hypothetical protein [Flavobacteriales bacterium]
MKTSKVYVFNDMKNQTRLLFYVFFLLQLSCSGPVPMIETEVEKKWNDSIEKVYPYNIVLFKGIIMNGIPDCGDSSFKIYVYYVKEKNSTDSNESMKKKAIDIAKSYSHIRDYKECVEFIYVKFIDTTNYKNNFGGKYDILNDKMQTGIEVY